MAPDTQSPIVRFGVGLGAFLAVIGAPISGYFLFQIFLEARASEHWPSVDGQLMKTRVGETSVGRFYPDVSYRYTVNGQPYTGSRLRASDGEYSHREGVEQDIQGLNVGQQIAVYYNPNIPSESVLYTGAGFQEYALLAVPLIMLGMGISAFIRLRATRPSPTPDASGD